MSVIIVTGMPRSGTSMMMRILQTGGIPLHVNTIMKTDEFNPHGYFEHSDVRSMYANGYEWVKDIDGKAVKVVNSYLETFNPDVPCKYICMTRDEGELAESEYRLYSYMGGLDTLEELDETVGAAQQAMIDLLHSRGSDMIVFDYQEFFDEPSVALEKLKTFIGDDFNVKKAEKGIDHDLRKSSKITRRKRDTIFK